MGNSQVTMQNVLPSSLVFSESIHFNVNDWYNELVRLYPTVNPNKIKVGLQLSVENVGKFIVKDVQPPSGTYYTATAGERTLYLVQTD